MRSGLEAVLLGNFFGCRSLCILREAILDDVLHYARLEQGARYLAAQARSHAERQTHLGWANRYNRLKIEALPQDMLAAVSA